jgi:aspartate aminotransferase
VPDFTKAAAVLAYGPDSAPLKEGRIVITQSISGTGALRIGGAFLERFYPGDKTIYIPNPSWANHNAVFKDSGLKVEKYRYYNKDTIGLDFEGMVEDIKNMPKGSIVLLHACAHNPTGVDPTEEQWRALSDVVKENGHYPFFDMAYQGFASGNTDQDAFPIRHFIKEGHNISLCQSFAKNMVSLTGNLCGETHMLTLLRVSTVSVLVPSPSSAPMSRRRSVSTPRSRSWFALFTPTLLFTVPVSLLPS